MTLQPGDTFDRYTIEAILGEGGMGTVYRAWDPRLQRRVALKTLRTDRAEGSENATDASARMVREARAAAALEHAGCVAIFDVGEHEGTRFIAMEFIDGAPLRRFVGDLQIPLEQRVRWLVDVARALSAAHKRGLIHRDVKPENVMVRTDGVIKVLDFGIAKRAVGESTATGPRSSRGLPLADLALGETAAGVVSGTPQYMAPEQLRQQPLDARTDQFAWGLVAYELLTGRHPFRSPTSGTEFVLAILNVEPVPPSRLVPHVPAVVQATVLKALAKSPAARFSSMDHVVSALEPFAGLATGRGVAAVSSGTAFESVKTELAMPVDAGAPPPPRSARGARLAAAALGAVGLAVAVGGAVAMRARAGDTSARRTTAPIRGDEGHGLAMTAVPPPPAHGADALAEYGAGLEALRAGTFDTARQAFTRATTLDPSLASAHLRLALLASLVASETEARQSFRRAIEFKAQLPERDQALVDAFEPYLQRVPSDVKESARRLAAAVDARPNDAELRLYLGTVQFDAGDTQAASDTFQRAIDLDPEFAEAWSYRGATQAFLGQLDQALASFDRCLAVSLGATDCLWYRVLVHDDQGACDEVESDARTWIAKSPDDAYAYHTLSRALFARGADDGAVRAALAQSWAHTDEGTRARTRLWDELRLDLIAGDFSRALARSAGYDAALASEPAAAVHARLAAVLTQIHEELGQVGEAGRVAGEFLDRRDAWVAPTRVDDIAISTDFTPAMLAVQRAAGGLKAGELEARREAWLRTWEAKTSATYLPHLWIYGYAASARTPEDARRALEALPRYQPLPAFMAASAVPQLAIGQVFLLAGRAGDATAPLLRASRSCVTIDEPLEYVKSHLLLGRAREATGERAAACAAYAVVTRRWGAAKPRSRSADEARAAMTRLACPK